MGTKRALSTAAAAVVARAPAPCGPVTLVVTERIQAADDLWQLQARVQGGGDVDTASRPIQPGQNGRQRLTHGGCSNSRTLVRRADLAIALVRRRWWSVAAAAKGGRFGLFHPLHGAMIH